MPPTKPATPRPARKTAARVKRPTQEEVAAAVEEAVEENELPSFTIDGVTHTATRGLDLVRGFGFRRAVRGMDDIDASIYLVEKLFDEDALMALDGYDIASAEFIDIMDQIFVGEEETLGGSLASSD